MSHEGHSTDPRPIREPAKPTKKLRFLLARVERDERFADIVDHITDIGQTFLATPSLIEDAAAVIAYQLRKNAYALKQVVLDEDEE